MFVYIFKTLCCDKENKLNQTKVRNSQGRLGRIQDFEEGGATRTSKGARGNTATDHLEIKGCKRRDFTHSDKVLSEFALACALKVRKRQVFFDQEVRALFYT